MDLIITIKFGVRNRGANFDRNIPRDSLPIQKWFII
jgi:hypothetical protein